MAEAHADLDTMEAKSERHRHALRQAEKLIADYSGAVENPLNQIVRQAGTVELDRARKELAPSYFSEASRTRAEKAAAEGFKAMVARQIEAMLRISDRNAIDADPEYQAEQARWVAYDVAVGQAARAQGNTEATFVAQCRELFSARRAAEAVGDGTQAIDRRLTAMGIPWPTAPPAAEEPVAEVPVRRRTRK
jgi:hypothetical protein